MRRGERTEISFLFVDGREKSNYVSEKDGSTRMARGEEEGGKKGVDQARHAREKKGSLRQGGGKKGNSESLAN